jgi:hypothetical protein
MPKAIIFITLLLFVICSFGQQSTNTSAPKPNTDYLQKSKKQKTAAWVLLGGGTALFFTGAIIMAHETSDVIFEGEEDAFGTGAVIGTTGLLAMGGSIPLFIASGKNKKIASASVSFKMEKATIIKSSMAYSSRYPAVGLQIRL